MIGGKHAACPDADIRCVHGEDEMCPALGPQAKKGHSCKCNRHSPICKLELERRLLTTEYSTCWIEDL